VPHDALALAARAAHRMLRLSGAHAALPDEVAAMELGDDEWLSLNVFMDRAARGRWVSSKGTWGKTLESCIETLHQRFAAFSFGSTPFSVVLELIAGRGDVELASLQQDRFADTRFEPGVTGLCFRRRANAPGSRSPHEAPEISHYTALDTWLKSHHELRQVKESLSKPLLAALHDDPASIRVTRTDSRAVLVSPGETVVPLVRGQPPPPEWTASSVGTVLLDTLEWLHGHRYDDGRFWYYYDPRRDSRDDHTHPTLKDRYYNWVRHAHAVVAFVDGARRFEEPAFLETARAAIGPMLDSAFVYERAALGPGIFRGKRRCLLCNRKGKLGASGNGLTGVMKYIEATGDESLVPAALELLRHIDGQILPTGEFQGYYIHPAYDDGRPLDTLSDDVRTKLFSFYYPGEALFGMAMCLTVLDLEADERAYLRRRILLALGYLLDKRPVDYAHLFQSLPSEAWLVQAIECLVVSAGLKIDSAVRFVKQDSEQLCRQMYRGETPYPDYDGGFFYKYGDPVYVDGARMEGLLSAYRIAAFLGDRDWCAAIDEACATGARSLLLLYNTERHAYCFPRPADGTSTFRLKFTRQWTRVDNAVHCYCALSGALDLGLVPARPVG
jgi:hypothetical protein